jgi:tRNA (mo5U34)-methyltransferase
VAETKLPIAADTGGEAHCRPCLPRVLTTDLAGRTEHTHMDLSRIKAYGISRTRKAWFTNPARSIAWRLMLPYFQGLAAEIDHRLETETTARARTALGSDVIAGVREAGPVQPDRMLFDGFDVEVMRALVPLCRWVHSIDLGNGQISPGLWGKNPEIMGANIDFRNKQVLDIGCWDGLHSFLAEDRGASVIFATDVISARSYNEFPTFHLAHKLRSSSAKYYSDLSVYDLSLLQKADFDVVIFTGVYYHLRDPLRALDSIRSVMKTNGTILIEGAISKQEGCHANFYHDKLFCGDPTNWWIPSVECLEQWVISSGFAIVNSYPGGGHLENQRHIILATAT